MAILEIKKFNDKVLRQRAQEVKEINSEIRKLVLDMGETMKANNGIGLAAPQVGVLKRVIVLENGALINPYIIRKYGTKIFDEEGCLSFPEIYINIKRYGKIEVEAMDIEGKEIIIKAEGLLARVIQHEIDHIDGIPFFNRLGFWEKIKFKLKHWSFKF